MKITNLYENTDLKPFNFNEFIKDSCDFAEAMTLDVNQKVLPEMLDKNMSNWDQLLYMVKEGQLLYREDTMKTFKTFSDKPKSFVFTYTFKDFDTAQVAGHAVMGYMTGTYEQPVVEVTYQGDDFNKLVIGYAEDKKLNHIFKRICDSFKDYYHQPEDMTDEELDALFQE